MTSASDKLQQLESKEMSGWLEEAKVRQANQAWRDLSFKIAVRILREIRIQKPFNGMTQKVLAEAMGVSPQYINKVVKGNENLTLETISKIETILGIRLIEIVGFASTMVNTIESPSGEGVSRRDAQLSIKKTFNLKEYSDYEPENQPNGTYGY